MPMEHEWPVHAPEWVRGRYQWLCTRIPGNVKEWDAEWSNLTHLFCRWTAALRRYHNRYGDSMIPSLRRILGTRASTWPGIRKAFLTRYLPYVRPPWARGWWCKAVITAELHHRSNSWRFCSGYDQWIYHHSRETWREAWRQARLLNLWRAYYGRDYRIVCSSTLPEGVARQIRTACRLRYVPLGQIHIVRGYDFPPFTTYVPSGLDRRRWVDGLVGERWLLRELGLPPTFLDDIRAVGSIQG